MSNWKLYRSALLPLGGSALAVHKKLPQNAKIVDVIDEKGVVTLLYYHDLEMRTKVTRTFAIIYPGMEIEPSCRYIGRVYDKPLDKWLCVLERIHDEVEPGT